MNQIPPFAALLHRVRNISHTCSLNSVLTVKQQLKVKHSKNGYFQSHTNYLYAEYIMRNAGLEEDKLELRLLGEISTTLDMQMTPPLWQKVKRN